MAFFRKDSNRKKLSSEERNKLYNPEQAGGNFRFPLVDDSFAGEQEAESSPYEFETDELKTPASRRRVKKAKSHRSQAGETPVSGAAPAIERRKSLRGREAGINQQASSEEKHFRPTDVPKPVAIYEPLEESEMLNNQDKNHFVPTDVPKPIKVYETLGEKRKKTKPAPKPVPTSSKSVSSEKEAPSTFDAIMRQRENKRSQSEVAEQVANVVDYGGYQLPSYSFLQTRAVLKVDEAWIERQAETLDDTLYQFGVNAKVVNYSQGPTVTRFEIQPEPGVKVSKITNLSDDLKLSLAAKDIRIEAPIPGRPMIGIEIPNRQSRPVFIREILEEKVFTDHPSPLAIAMGLDIAGKPITTDLRKMPHGLVAGSTGSGKSVFINSLLISLLYKSSPEDVKLMLVDPKMVELSCYNGIPHLVTPVITDPKAATAALKWAVEEMDRRYESFAQMGVREIAAFNEKMLRSGRVERKMPYLVIVIDELADLMMTSPVEVEEAICRIAQKARACGIHLIVATQRPSVDVITGLIKANIATRIAFSVSAQIDSRTILDQGGAEKLLGRGDMLFLENGTSKTVRLQGTYVNDEEIEKVVRFVSKQATAQYLFSPEELMKASTTNGSGNGFENEQDELFIDACAFAIETGAVSTSSLQRRFRIGYNRAARMVDLMEQYGVVSEANGTKPRNVLISYDDLDRLRELADMNQF